MTKVRSLLRLLVVFGAALCGLAVAPRASAQVIGDALPPPVDVPVTTKDGVNLRMTYFASNAGREAVPVILLHDFNETRAVLEPLANELQNPPRLEDERRRPILPRAVVTVDLRGHGDSKTGFDPDGAAFELDAQRLQLQDFQDMVVYDLEAVRSFLVDENDAGRLNLNKLCVVGCGMGANVAIVWAARDWATPPLPVRKQGQDVKALGLISPRWNFRGLALVEPMKFPPIQRELSIFLAYGAGDPGVAKDCGNVERILERYHPKPPAGQPPRGDFVVEHPPTTLQGSPLLNSREFDLIPNIAGFIEARIAARPFAYVPRKK